MTFHSGTRFSLKPLLSNSRSRSRLPSSEGREQILLYKLYFTGMKILLLCGGEVVEEKSSFV